MDSGPVKPARRWPLLPTRRAGEPATAPVSPSDYVNPALRVAPPGGADSQGRHRDRTPRDDKAPAEDAAAGGITPHLVDRSV